MDPRGLGRAATPSRAHGPILPTSGLAKAWLLPRPTAPRSAWLGVRLPTNREICERL